MYVPIDEPKRRKLAIKHLKDVIRMLERGGVLVEDYSCEVSRKLEPGEITREQTRVITIREIRK